MNILCVLFGHKPPKGYCSFEPGYARQPHPVIWRDGTGRGHVKLRGECGRCGVGHHIVSFHPPAAWRGPDEVEQ